MRDPWRPAPGRRLALAVAGTAAALVVAGSLVTRALPDGDDSRAAGAASPAPAVAASPAGSRAPAADGGPGGAQDSGAVETAEVDQAQVDASTSEVRDVATRAVAAWQLPDSAARAAALTPLATPAFAEAAATIDPTVVPTSPVATASTVADADGLARVRVTLADGTALLVDLELGADWLASGILPEA